MWAQLCPQDGDSLEVWTEPLAITCLDVLKLHKGWEMGYSGTRVTGSLKGDEKEALPKRQHGVGFVILFLLQSPLK